MSDRTRFRLLLTVLAAFVAGLGMLLMNTPRPARAAAVAATTNWEYQTASVDAASLATKLIECGRDGWEVFAIVSTDAIVENAPDGKPHVTTQRFEVTAKRPKAN